MSLEGTPPQSNSLRSIIGWVCVVAAIGGLVVPIAQLPMVGDINLIAMAAGGEMFAYIILTIIAAVLIYTKRFRLVAIPALILLISIVIYAFYLESIKAQMVDTTAGNMFSGIAVLASSSIHLQWGIAYLTALGVALLLVALLDNDAATLPELFNANKARFFQAGVAGLVVLGGLSFAPMLTPHHAERAVAPVSTETMAPTRPDPTVAADAAPPTESKEQLMRKIISVGLLEKSFVEADPMNGQYSAQFAVKFQYHNLGSKMIVGFKGTLAFSDQFGERISGFNVESDANIGPGRIQVKDLYYDYNQFMESDQKLKRTPFSKLHVQWNPTHINFSDGSSANAGSE